PAPRVVPAFSSQFLAATRIHQVLALPKDYRLVTVAEVCDAPPEQTLRMGDLVVEKADGQLLARTRDGKHQFEIMQLMGDYLSMVVGDCFSLLATSSHTPRITIDRLVVSREGWRMRADEVDFTTISDQADCFAHVRAWARSYGMPRFLFYRVAKEKKPCFLDLTSPLSVELFVKDVRRMVNSDDTEGFIVSLSEMMPDPEHAWLIDAAGNRYTCEIRLALFDRKQ
ncbi:MAG: lantibiotic dehydratase, partial [Ktedonobacterales bacterium]|nr:lantibiotic dehydratase [Ktedonobacterales bacterium]